VRSSNNPSRKHTITALLLVAATVCTMLSSCGKPSNTSTRQPDADPAYKLWYDKPASQDSEGFEHWSLPIGNGYMGVSIFGGTEQELLSVNENSMFNPPNYSTNLAVSPEGEPRMKHNADGMNLLSKTYIAFGHPFSQVTNYRRDLVLDTAEAHVSYDYDGVTYEREYFASYPDKVTVMRFTASQAGKLSFTLRPTVPFVRGYLNTEGDGKGKSGKVVAEGDTVTLSGLMHYYGINFEAQYKVIPTGGKLTAQDGTICVENADSALVIMAVGTNYNMVPETFTAPVSDKLDRNELPHDKVSGYISDAAGKTYDQLKQAHRADFQKYFQRVDLELGGKLNTDMTTDQLLQTYKNGEQDPYVEEILFQYGRYLLIASSRKGCLPANLQGIWNFYEAAAWGGGYVNNINVSMNYWPAFSTNLMEMFESYADYNLVYRQEAQKLADAYLQRIGSPYMARGGTGENGWAVGSASYPASINAPDPTTHSGPGIGAFVSLLLWDYYDFTRDKTVLETYTYPAVEGMATFLSKTVKDYDGKWLVYNSASPENANYYRTVGTGFDQQMLYENHLATLTAAELLGYTEADHPILATVRQQIDRLDPVNVGACGQVKEYREENFYGEIGEKEHRHISQLVGLHPGTSINSKTDAWMDAARVSLINRGDGTVGWDIAHRLLCWARLEDSEHSYDLVRHMITKSITNNLWNSYPPFQIDGNFGYTAGVAEMLLQSHEGYLQLLPALPDAWVTGSYSGLTARGNFEVDAAWEKGQATQFVIRSRAGSDCALVYPNIAGAVITDSKGNAVAVTAEGSDKVSFATTAWETYTVTQIPAYTKVAAPSQLSLEATGAAMQLRWQASEDAVSYNVYRAVNDQATYEPVATGITDTAYTYTPADLSNSDQVTLRVTAVGQDGRESTGITVLRNSG